MSRKPSTGSGGGVGIWTSLTRPSRASSFISSHYQFLWKPKWGFFCRVTTFFNAIPLTSAHGLSWTDYRINYLRCSLISSVLLKTSQKVGLVRYVELHAGNTLQGSVMSGHYHQKLPKVNYANFTTTRQKMKSSMHNTVLLSHVLSIPWFPQPQF